jgi:asparagine synthase (glutamine-hydrolysing)
MTMIFAGAFNQRVDAFNQKELESVVRRAICDDITCWHHDTVSVVAGKTWNGPSPGWILSVKGGVFLGKAFNKHTFKAINEKDLEEYLGKPSEEFCNTYWGSYIFIIAVSGTIEIVRDATGQLPLFYAKATSGEIIFASEIEILVEILGRRPSFNWDYLSSFVLRTFITTEQTAFEGMYELPHGCKLKFTAPSETIECDIAWNPLHYVNEYRGPELTKQAIIDISSNVIRSWTKDAKLLSLDFSGGTDSTAILLLLNSVLEKEQNVKLINMFHPQVASSDERCYASAIAKKLGMQLTEFDYSRSMPYDQIASSPLYKPNWPSSLLSFQKINDDISDLFDSSDRVIYISGHGGDHLFMTCPPLTSLSDYLIKFGPTGLAVKMRDLYLLYREPIWTLLLGMGKSLASYYLRSNYWAPTPLNKFYCTPWLHSEIFAREKRMRYHPFFNGNRGAGCLPGKRQHIEAIYNGLATIRADVRDGGTNPVFFPLFSQPLMELALSIPTYESYQSGFSRFLFRDALSNAFKTDAVWRRDKGVTGGVSQRGLAKNQERILEICLDGEFSKHGLIDREKLQDGMHKVIAGQVDHEWAVTNVICAEIFLSNWR